MYVKTKNLPISIQAALRGHQYWRKDIRVHFQDEVGIQGGSGKGNRSYTAIVNTTMGTTKVHMGSWGGPNPFNSDNPVDVGTQSISLARDVWVIKGCEGYKPHANLYCHPKAKHDFAYTKAFYQPTDSERKVLRAYNDLKSGPYRNEALACVSNRDQVIDFCVAKGLIKRSKNGACRITTEGKNALVA